MSGSQATPTIVCRFNRELCLGCLTGCTNLSGTNYGDRRFLFAVAGTLVRASMSQSGAVLTLIAMRCNQVNSLHRGHRDLPGSIFQARFEDEGSCVGKV